MKRIYIITVLLLVFNVSLYSQNNFEGILTFKIQMQDKTGQMSDDESNLYIGTEQKYYLKGKKYKSEMNGLLEMKTIHEGKDSIFMMIKGQDALMFELTNVADEKIISYEFKETNEVILGYKCELLEVKTDKGFHKYYFNRNFKNGPDSYENHHMGLWSFFNEKTGGAISLKSISDLEEIKSSMVLISIENKELEDSIFTKPKGFPILKMPKD